MQRLKPFVIEVVRNADVVEPAFGEWIYAQAEHKGVAVAEHAIKRMYDTDPLCRAVLVAFGFYKADGTPVKCSAATTNKFRDGCQHNAWYLCKAVEWAFEGQAVQDSTAARRPSSWRVAGMKSSNGSKTRASRPSTPRR